MITFKDATIDDLVELSKLYKHKTDEQELNHQALHKKRINKTINDNQKEYLLILLDKEVIGHVFVDCSKSISHMQSLFIREDLRNRGHGTEVINEIERKMTAKGIKQMKTSVNPDNNPIALRLYKKLGYRKTNKEKYLDYVDPYDGGEDWVIDLEKTLD